MAHDYHGDLGPEGTIFYDGCAECEQRAALGLYGLLTQSPDRIEALYRRMLVTEKHGPVDDLPGDGDQKQPYTVTQGYQSDAEAKVGKLLYYAAVLAERGDDPDPWRQGRFYRG